MSELAEILSESISTMLDVIAEEVKQPREIVAHAFLASCFREAFARQHKRTGGLAKSLVTTFEHGGVLYVAEWRDSMTPPLAERYNETLKGLRDELERERQRAEDAELIVWAMKNNHGRETIREVYPRLILFGDPDEGYCWTVEYAFWKFEHCGEVFFHAPPIPRPTLTDAARAILKAARDSREGGA